MSRIKVKNLPKLRLKDLLRRRKMTLEMFIEDSGVQTYEGLVNRCNRIGCQPPLESEYKKIRPEFVNSQADGVVVAEPIPVIEELTGREIDPDAPVTLPGISVITKKLIPDSSNDVKRKGRPRKKKLD